MYKRHKIIISLLAIFVFSISFFAPLHYAKIAEVAITIISITLAVYISVATALLGSAFSKSLKKLPDKEDPHKSMLGVLSSYLRWAGVYSVITIIISSIYIIWPGITEANDTIMLVYFFASRGFSSFACALFSVNIVFMSIIMEFLVVSLNNAAVMTD